MALLIISNGLNQYRKNVKSNKILMLLPRSKKKTPSEVGRMYTIIHPIRAANKYSYIVRYMKLNSTHSIIRKSVKFRSL